MYYDKFRESIRKLQKRKKAVTPVRKPAPEEKPAPPPRAKVFTQDEIDYWYKYLQRCRRKNLAPVDMSSAIEAKLKRRGLW